VDHIQTDLIHIDFIIPLNDAEKERLYTKFIARECHLCGLQLHSMQVEEWRYMLWSIIMIEKFITALEKVRISKKEDMKPVPLVEVVELLIPCILYLENHVGKKDVNNNI
jgi:hypothetical protein